MFGILKPSVSKRAAAIFPSRIAKREYPARQPPSSPSLKSLLLQSVLLSDLSLPTSTEHQLGLPSAVDASGSVRPVCEIRPITDFPGPLSTEGPPHNRGPVRKIRLLRRRQAGVSATDARNVLIAGFAQREDAAALFPTSLTDTSTRDAVRRFQLHIDTVITNTNDVCVSCGLFISFGAGTVLTKVHPVFTFAVEAAIIIKDEFDCYGYSDAGFHFCESCYTMVVEKKIPKFGSINCINVSPCQKYTGVLKNLTVVGEAVIAWAHPIMLIMKLRSTLYHRIRDHTVLLPQNLGPLLTILPLSFVALHDAIRLASDLTPLLIFILLHAFEGLKSRRHYFG